MVGILAAPFLIALALGVAALLGRSKARRINRSRQAEYLAARIQAKRDGLPPPMPPNVIRWGR